MAIEKYDVFVIGTGRSGKDVASACANAGWRVAIADNREYGGVCANRGCDPKKVLYGLTEILQRAHDLKGYGITKAPNFSWKDLQKFKETFTGAVPFVHERRLKEEGITLYHQSPKFLDENTLSVEGKTVKAEKIVIASGQIPRKLHILGEEHMLTSDDFLSLEEMPETMVFIGGGYVGMELAHIAARCGVNVTVIHSRQQPLNDFDPAIVDYLVKASEEIGIKFIFNARANKVEKLQKNLRVTADQDGKEIQVKTEMVINAAGRVPSIDDLQLEKGNVTYTNRGITVNSKMQNPGNENVYASGDVSDSSGLPLTPLSPFESKIVISQLLDEKDKLEVEYPVQPSAVFTIPQVAKVGLSEQDAKKKKIDVIVKVTDGEKWFNAKRIRAFNYASKVILEKDSGKILGAHLVGAQAAEVINLFSMAIYQGMTATDLNKMLFSYPSWGRDMIAMVD